MTTPPLAEVPVRSAAELTRRWSTVLDPPRFASHEVWLMWLRPDGRSLPLVVPVDLPAAPDPAAVAGLVALHEAVVEDGPPGHLAMALCRPGHSALTATDDAWSAALRDALDDRPGTWSLHLAAGGQVVPLVDAPERAWRRG